MNQSVATTNKKISDTIDLTPEQFNEFNKQIKIGIYKELHKKGLLTNEQLKQLITMQNK